MRSLVLAVTLALGHQAFALNVDQLFYGISASTPACYAREYSGTHLRSNPRQTVREIKVKLTRQESYPVLTIAVKRVNESREWKNSISCMDDESQRTVRCAVDCDGGSVEVLSVDSAGTMKLRNHGVLLHGGCGEEEDQTIYLEAQKGGDDVFVIPSVDPRYCR